MGRPLKDITGHRYGKLIVTKRLDKNKYGTYYYICRCDCGNDKIINSADLRRNTRLGTQSCGCLLKRKPPGTSAFYRTFRRMKRQAVLAGRFWDLDKDQVRMITSSSCFYCGTNPYQITRDPTSNGEYAYNGIDRFDNKKGYIFENCVPCCGKCNHAKSKYTASEFKEWVIKIYSHWAKF